MRTILLQIPVLSHPAIKSQPALPLVSALAEHGTDTLQQGGPVGLVGEQGQQVGSVRGGSTSLELDQMKEALATTTTTTTTTTTKIIIIGKVRIQEDSIGRVDIRVYLVEGKQQLLLKVWANRGDLGVQMLQPVHQQTRAEPGLAHLRAWGRKKAPIIRVS